MYWRGKDHVLLCIPEHFCAQIMPSRAVAFRQPEVAAPVKHPSHRHLRCEMQVLTESQNVQCSVLAFWVYVCIWSLLVCCYREVSWCVSLSSAEQRVSKHGDKTPSSIYCCLFEDAQVFSVSLRLWKDLHLYGLALCVCFALKNCFGFNQQDMLKGKLFSF